MVVSRLLAGAPRTSTTDRWFRGSSLALLAPQPPIDGFEARRWRSSHLNHRSMVEVRGRPRPSLETILGETMTGLAGKVCLITGTAAAESARPTRWLGARVSWPVTKRRTSAAPTWSSTADGRRCCRREREMDAGLAQGWPRLSWVPVPAGRAVTRWRAEDDLLHLQLTATAPLGRRVRRESAWRVSRHGLGGLLTWPELTISS